MAAVSVAWWRLDEPGQRDWLSPAECARADRFVSAELTERFVAGRAGLRMRLGAMLGLAPGAVPIEQGAHGKPELAGGPAFNLSHSGFYAVLAVSQAEVGVDVEGLLPVGRDLAARYFSAAERAAIAAWSDPIHGFHAVWTAKEAVMKGLGLGFHLPLTAFEVDARPDAPPRLTRLETHHGCAAEWTLARIDAPPGFTATISVRAPSIALSPLGAAS